ncbi:MAG: hypothetical protein QXQ68_07805 [Candidatus Nitrosocaldaceae archaeon]
MASRTNQVKRSMARRLKIHQQRSRKSKRGSSVTVGKLVTAIVEYRKMRLWL